MEHTKETHWGPDNLYADQSEVEHTKTPWEIRGGMTPEYTCIIGQDGDVIDNFGTPRKPSLHDAPEIPLEEHRANAAFIVKACNNFDALVEALKGCMPFMTAGGMPGYEPDVKIAKKKARAALEAAKKEGE